MKFLIAALCTVPLVSVAIDNGLGVTPPRGWRSWNSYPCEDSTNTTLNGGDIISDSAMRTAMAAVIDKTRTVNGTQTSLQELGYSWVSMDDGWQQCNCSTHQDMDPTLPTCSIGDCRGGKCSFHDPGNGTPMVNAHRFPSGMKALVDYGHSLGLKVGTYLNNCICMEASKTQHYEEDVAWMMAAGFDGVKIDNCGSSHNVSHYAELFNATGKPIRIEDCHTSPTHPQMKGGVFECPMNMYRSGGDIKASFGSIIGEIYATVEWADRSFPLSRPGCWAYPDMMQMGNFGGDEPTRSHEEQTHFGLWSIVSSPLILGFDMGDKEKMDRVWPTITNADALAINHDWVGHPGTLVKAYPAVGLGSVRMATQASCGANGTTGWKLTDAGQLQASVDGGAALCLLGSQNYGPANNAISCPPATTQSGLTQCGNALFDCSQTAGKWALNTDPGNSTLSWTRKAGDKPLCLTARAGHTAPDRSASGPGGKGPASSTTIIGQCPQPGHPVPNVTMFTLTSDGELQVGNGTSGATASASGAAGAGTCLSSAPAPGVQLWSKPLSGSKVAILVLNPLSVPQAVSLPLADIPGLACGGAADGAGGAGATTSTCAVRDVWKGTDGTTTGSSMELSLAVHQSVMYILGASN